MNPVKFINFWPPYLGAGIKVRRISKDFREVDVEMKFRWWNRNFVGTSFGGSLYSMTDPIYMMMLIHNLGPEYIVWDKRASIDFLKPGRSKVSAHFRLSQEEIEYFRTKADAEKKVEHELGVNIIDPEGNIIATVKKLLYVRRKDSIKPKTD
jgi:acyl-coenzyme A thioesterase PaaI-like protein